MPDTQLIINVGGSALQANMERVREWRALLDCADSIALSWRGTERVRVDLGGLRRWIAFKRILGGSPFYCIGYQETVGAIHRHGAIIGGSNRKVLAWMTPGGLVSLGDSPEGGEQNGSDD